MEYHKINSVFKRRMDTKEKLFIMGDYADPAFEYLANNEWEFTEKVDGTNIRVMFDGEKLRFGGKTDNAQMPYPLVEKLQELFTVDKLAQVFNTDEKNLSQGEMADIILYGEGCGFRIQKGGENYVNKEKIVDFILFDIKVGRWWLTREKVQEVAQALGIRAVPVVGYGTIKDAIERVANGMISTYGDFIAEGLVLRPKVTLFDRGGNRIITKIKHRDFKHLRDAGLL